MRAHMHCARRARTTRALMQQLVAHHVVRVHRRARHDLKRAARERVARRELARAPAPPAPSPPPAPPPTPCCDRTPRAYCGRAPSAAAMASPPPRPIASLVTCPSKRGRAQLRTAAGASEWESAALCGQRPEGRRTAGGRRRTPRRLRGHPHPGAGCVRVLRKRWGKLVGVWGRAPRSRSGARARSCCRRKVSQSALSVRAR